MSDLICVLTLYPTLPMQLFIGITFNIKKNIYIKLIINYLFLKFFCSKYKRAKIN